MAIERYIIDKSDLSALLRGECLAIQPKGNIRGFCVEITGNLTNGDVIKALFPNALRSNYIENDMTTIYLRDEKDSEMVVPEDWWNAPYKAESATKKPSWLGKNCKDCGNEKCKKLGTLPKGYDCALWQSESEVQDADCD